MMIRSDDHMITHVYHIAGWAGLAGWASWLAPGLAWKTGWLGWLGPRPRGDSPAAAPGEQLCEILGTR